MSERLIGAPHQTKPPARTEAASTSGHLVGVLGGVGPAATVYFEQRLVERTRATRDQDHVRTLVMNDAAIPDRTAFILGESDESPVGPLVADARMLEACGCDVLALPCNTAHYFFDELQAAVGVPIINMVRETMAHCAQTGMTRLGVLGTIGTMQVNIFGREGAAFNVECVYPELDVQRQVNAIIYDDVKAGRAVDPGRLDALANMFADAGCQGIVLGCTELSFAFGRNTNGHRIAVVDPLEVLVEKVIEHAEHELRS